MEPSPVSDSHKMAPSRAYTDDPSSLKRRINNDESSVAGSGENGSTTGVDQKVSSLKRARSSGKPSVEDATEQHPLQCPQQTVRPETLPVIHRLRLEAIFYPKFDNEASTKEIRKSMLDHIEKQEGYLEVSLKHSGSLVLWSGGQRFYSKNSTHNQFTFTAEILLRQHFERAWRETSSDGMNMYQECSDFLNEHRLTLSFEVITSFLGDHGERPKKDFLILTAVADRSNESFWATPELLELAHKFRLPHNDSWMFSRAESSLSLFDVYDLKRETGLATDTVADLSDTADVVIPSMYPHVDFQGEILEGFIVRYVPYRSTCSDGENNQSGVTHKIKTQLEQLSVKARQILEVVPSHLSLSYQVPESTHKNLEWAPVLLVNLRRIAREGETLSFPNALLQVLRDVDRGRCRIERFAMPKDCLPSLTKGLVQSYDPETKRIARLLQTLEGLKQPVKFSILKETMGYSEQNISNRYLSIVHVAHDGTFRRFRQAAKNSDMQLFRGFCISLIPEPDSMTEDSTVVEASDALPKVNFDEILMLKMKLLPYMVRTFLCRNELETIQNKGINAYMGRVSAFFQRWEFSEDAKLKWMPFLGQWAKYVMHESSSASTLPDVAEILSSLRYLSHFEHFTALRASGELTAGITPVVSSSFWGFACVVAPTFEEASRIAGCIGSLLDAEPHNVVSLRDTKTHHAVRGVVAYADVISFSKRLVRTLVEQNDENSALVLYGLSEDELHSGCFKAMSERDRKKWTGILNGGWRAQKIKVIVDVPKTEPLGADALALKQAAETIKENLLNWKMPTQKPGMVVFFPGIPGCGKSTLVRATSAELRSRLDAMVGPSGSSKRKVLVAVGDEMGRKNFWLEVGRAKQGEPSAVMIVDKNVPKPSWDRIQSLCAPDIPVPVIPDKLALETATITGVRKMDGSFLDEEGTKKYPFSLKYLAVCMARVMDRAPGSHPGGLDSATPNACLVVASFFDFYCSLHAEDLVSSLGSHLRCGSVEPIEIPFLSAGSPPLPAELKECLENTLQYPLSKLLRKPDDESPSIISSIAGNLQEKVTEHREFLLSIACGVEESSNVLLGAIVDRVTKLDNGLLQDVKKNPTIKLVSIDVERTDIIRVMQKHCAAIQVCADLADGKAYLGSPLIPRAHVTMAFHNRLESSLRNEWEHVQGAEIAIRMKSFVWNKNNAAFFVEIEGTTEDGRRVPRCQNEFPHITVWVAPDAEASWSNRLFEKAGNNSSSEVVFPEPISIRGRASFWDFNNAPLPNPLPEDAI